MSAPKIHEFKKSLSKGKKAEAEFLSLFPDLIAESSGGFIEDFTILANGKTIDLKTDFYCATKTENFFWERWSYKNQDGGAWQAKRKGVDYIVYFFATNMQFHCFEVKTLVRELDKIVPNLYLHNIYNSSHVTQGYKVKRADLEHIELDLEKVLKGKL